MSFRTLNDPHFTVIGYSLNEDLEPVVEAVIHDREPDSYPSDLVRGWISVPTAVGPDRAQEILNHMNYRGVLQ